MSLSKFLLHRCHSLLPAFWSGQLHRSRQGSVECAPEDPCGTSTVVGSAMPSQADGLLGCGRIIIATHIELTPPPQATKVQSERYVNDSFLQHVELPAQPSKLRRLCGKHALCPPPCLLLKYPNTSFHPLSSNQTLSH